MVKMVVRVFLFLSQVLLYLTQVEAVEAVVLLLVQAVQAVELMALLHILRLIPVIQTLVAVAVVQDFLQAQVKVHQAVAVAQELSLFDMKTHIQPQHQQLVHQLSQ
jgi:hypothetical protein